jgi:hypothetical protein
MASARLLAIIWSLTALTTICLGQPLKALGDMVNGNTGLFNSKGHPKAKGAVFTMKYPKDWDVSEGERPNVVKRFGYTDATVTALALVLTIKLPISEPFTRQDAESLFAPSELPSLVPEGGTYINGVRTKLEGEPAAIIEFGILAERLGATYATRALCLVFFQGNTMVQVQFGIYVEPSKASQLGALAATWRPVFDAMMNSIVFPDKWR